MGKKVLQIVGDQSIETLVHEYCFLLFPANSKSVPGQSINNVNKASGPFSIPTKILKLLKELISKPLEILFNCSFSLGVNPDSFKTA